MIMVSLLGSILLTLSFVFGSDYNSADYDSAYYDSDYDSDYDSADYESADLFLPMILLLHFVLAIWVVLLVLQRFSFMNLQRQTNAHPNNEGCCCAFWTALFLFPCSHGQIVSARKKTSTSGSQLQSTSASGFDNDNYV